MGKVKIVDKCPPLTAVYVVKGIGEAVPQHKTNKLGYPELCHNRLDCFCFVLNLVGVEQN